MASIKVLINLDKSNKKGDSPLFLRIIKNRKPKYISLGIYLNEDFWDEAKQRVRKNHPNSARLNAYISKKVAEAEAAVVDLETNSRFVKAKEIKEKIMGKPPVDFFAYADNYVNSLEAAGKICTYKRAKTVIQKLKDYIPSLFFNDLTVTFLKDYENHLVVKHNNKPNTIHSNFRIIRKIINDAVREDLITRNDNPFYKFVMRLEKTKRAFLTDEELKSLAEVQLPEGKIISTHRDIYVFAAFTGGLRISDILTLKWENFDGERIILNIQKTKTPLSIKIPNKALEIINKYKPENPNPKSFVFPLLNPDLDYADPKVLHRAISAATAYTNKNLKTISKKVEISKTVSFHTSRHTFATAALRKGIRIEYVSKLLGHANIKETQVYAKIVNEELEKAMEVFNN